MEELRSHILKRARKLAVLCLLRSDTKIKELDLTTNHQDVSWFDVSVNDPAAMNIGKCAQNLRNQ